VLTIAPLDYFGKLDFAGPRSATCILPVARDFVPLKFPKTVLVVGYRQFEWQSIPSDRYKNIFKVFAIRSSFSALPTQDWLLQRAMTYDTSF
jgi:hypothetical protein